MSVFRDELARDIDLEFLDLEAFGEEHIVGGGAEAISCVIDEDINAANGKAAGLNVTDATCVLYARVSDVPRKDAGDQLVIDGTIYTVVDWRVDEGLNRVALRSGHAFVGRRP